MGELIHHQYISNRDYPPATVSYGISYGIHPRQKEQIEYTKLGLNK